MILTRDSCEGILQIKGIRQMETFVVNKDYKDLHLLLTEIFKNNKKVEVVMDKKRDVSTSYYKHEECLFQ